MEAITSRDNQHVKELAGLLSSKKKRDASGLFVTEGARLCCDADESGVAVKTLFFTREALARYPALENIKAQRTMLLAPELARRIGDTHTPQGAFAICEKQGEENPFVLERQGKYLLLAGLQDPGNLGTILRTAQALGISGVCLADCPDLYAPKVLRAAMGGIFRLAVAVFETPAGMVEQLQEAGIPVYAAALTEEARPIGQVDLSGGCGVMIGNEGNGLDEALIQRCDGGVIIPMKGNAESLNAAVAASLFIWEMTR